MRVLMLSGVTARFLARLLIHGQWKICRLSIPQALSLAPSCGWSTYYDISQCEGSSSLMPYTNAGLTTWCSSSISRRIPCRQFHHASLNVPRCNEPMQFSGCIEHRSYTVRQKCFRPSRASSNAGLIAGVSVIPQSSLCFAVIIFVW